MNFINEKDTTEILKKARIEEIIGSYITVTRHGKSLKAVCPFHDDHDPSINISTEKQIFKCFVCGEGGNAFQFVQKYLNISFPQAVREVARKINYSLPEETVEVKPVDKGKKRLYELLDIVTAYAQLQLQNSNNKSILDYVLNRGITTKQIKDYQIGYLPNGKITDYLLKKKFTAKEIVDSGMGAIGDNGLIDMFSDRLMIPIHDQEGNVVGFTARTMGNDSRKYINTQETTIYSKGNLLYNYHRAATNAKRENCTIVVEGPMDALALERSGFNNVMASLGTALTKQQLLLLRKVSKKLIFCYDGDKAGQAANYKAGNLAIELGFKVMIANNDTLLDPDEIEKKYGIEKNKEIIEKAVEFPDFILNYLKSLYNLSTYEGKKAYTISVLKTLAINKDEVAKDYYIKQIATITSFDLDMIKKLDTAATAIEKPRKELKEKKQLQDNLINQYEIISQSLKSYQGIEIYDKELGFLIDDNCQNLMMYIKEYYRTHNEIELADLLNYLQDEKLRSICLDISENSFLSPNFDKKVLLGAIKEVKKDLIDKRLLEIRTQLSTIVDKEEYLKLLKEYTDLSKKKKDGV